MPAEITSRPYQPNPKVCCEACVFGRGEHAEWCERGKWVTCARCGGPMWVRAENLNFYYDCGLQHREGECLPLPPSGLLAAALARIEAASDAELLRMADDGCPNDAA